MSEDRAQRRSEPGDHYRLANELVRAILDDRTSTSGVSPSGELYRAIERTYGSYLQADVNVAAGSSMPSDTPRDLQRRFSREPRSRPSQPTLISSASLPPLRSRYRLTHTRADNTTGGNSRVRPLPTPFPINTDSRRRGERGVIESLYPRNPAPIESLGEPSDAYRYEQALPFSPDSYEAVFPPPSPPLVTSSVRAPDQSDDSRRAKRRKLESDRFGSGYKGFRYGRFGQVEEGELVMEIVSCDGGIYSDGNGYAAENILKDDHTVYCTKGNRCNIVLQHQGATPFTLTELVIKAPGRNYSSPVRQGMVFVSMKRDDLLQRTAQYQIQYVSEPPTRVERLARVRRETQSSVRVVHTLEDGSTSSEIIQLPTGQIHPPSSIGEEEGWARAQVPPEFRAAATELRVTTECTDDDNEEQPQNSRRWRRRIPNRIGSLPFEGDESDDGLNRGSPPRSQNEDLNFDFSRPLHSHNHLPYPRTLSEAAEASQRATQEAVRAVGGELMAPHACFHVEKDKTKCTLRFDPPVSGRYILLKMWNPHFEPKGNIDIQGVTTKGFAGPRYFPDVELR